ncbi:MAG TPA: SDR family oxidoreductase [Parvularculaceae bacterium]|nr:SDR family oxidoreductase [Parvularculaceae bacterium]
MSAAPQSLFDLRGKAAVITGASRGIGEAIARRLAEHGADVIVSSRKIDACEAVASSINEALGRKAARAAKCDIARKEDLKSLIDFADAELGKVDILVANAAVNPHFGSSETITDEQFDKIMTANVKATHWLSQFVTPQMKARRDGSIIIISSIGAFVGSNAIGAYTVSKAADLALARNIAVEFGPYGVRANCICPGIVKTYFAEALWKDPKVEAAVTKTVPLRRFGEPDDIAGAAVFLAAPAGRWMTGQQIVIDGGAMVSMGAL